MLIHQLFLIICVVPVYTQIVPVYTQILPVYTGRFYLCTLVIIYEISEDNLTYFSDWAVGKVGGTGSFKTKIFNFVKYFLL